MVAMEGGVWGACVEMNVDFQLGVQQACACVSRVPVPGPVQVQQKTIIRENSFQGPRNSAQNAITCQTRRKSALSHCTLKL
mgnify:CR=1 FL=1